MFKQYKMIFGPPKASIFHTFTALCDEFVVKRKKKRMCPLDMKANSRRNLKKNRSRDDKRQVISLFRILQCLETSEALRQKHPADGGIKRSRHIRSSLGLFVNNIVFIEQKKHLKINIVQKKFIIWRKRSFLWNIREPWTVKKSFHMKNSFFLYNVTLTQTSSWKKGLP